MLAAAVAVFSVVVLLGLTLALLHLQRRGGAPPALGALHGVLGAAGITLLLLAAAKPSAKAAGQGVGTFGFDATWLLSAALVLGLWILFLLRRGRRQQAGLLIALHGTIAVLGYVILAALWSLA